jgi:cell division septation protein DedD
MVSVFDSPDRENTLDEAPGQPEEFEFVLGRRQIASLLFVFCVVLMICIAGSYVVGKSTVPKLPAPVAPAPVAAAHEPEPPPIVMYREPAPAAAEPPLFAEPKIGSVYIQMAAIEKGVSVIFAEGLRKRGLPAFVASGPTDKIFRVLIGPLPDPASYVKAKDAVDKIGLATFARKYPN